MNLKHLSDKTLLTQTASFCGEERELLTKILWHLAEINARRLFSSLGYRSLFEYAVKELKYSEDQAFRRIKAMHLLVEIPQIAPKIDSGNLTLSQMGELQTTLKEASPEEKLEAIEKVEGKSNQETRDILQPEKPREVTIKVTPEVLEKLKKLKGLRAHKNLNLNQIIDELCELGTKNWDLAQRPTRTLKKARNPPATTKSLETTNPPATSRVTLRYIPASIKKQVWQKYQSKCSKCGSHHVLQIDHCYPIALGGRTELENLRLLCRNCNQQAAIKTYGLTKMSTYLERGRT